MTLVTTSRRSTIESRAVARDFAFALGAKYMARGKRGLRDLTEIDSSFFILSQEEKGLVLRWYEKNDTIFERRILKVENRKREGLITRGVVTSDIELQKLLLRVCPVINDDQDNDAIITFDGPQRRQTILKFEKKSKR
jgi:U3 small nucleolar ribonucleoprotein protein IMP4